jgi:SAM-dependent methyltransferase
MIISRTPSSGAECLPLRGLANQSTMTRLAQRAGYQEPQALAWRATLRVVTGPAGAEEAAGRLAAESIAAGDPTGWFERVYAAAAAGQAEVPWDRGTPSRYLTQWAAARGVAGAGRRALVVGCGLGDDAEFVAGLGFQTVAFDIAPTAIATARCRFPGSAVRYQTADLLKPPPAWQQAFDLVVESLTLQALPDPPRRDAIARLGGLVAAGGTLVVLARAREPGQHVPGPPWALSRPEIDALAADGLEPVSIEDLNDPQMPWPRRWRAEFRRPPGTC